MNTNLTEIQLGVDNKSQYAIFLPALSGFYATFVGKQRYDNYVDQQRIPSNFNNGVESLNYLNKNEGQFQYKWSLYSAGHAELDVNKHSPKEDMIRNRDRENTWLLGDSGGFQIGKNVWEGNWKDPNCPKAQKKREQVLTWMDSYMDYGMILDIPAWAAKNPESATKIGVGSYQDAVNGTYINNDWFIRHRNGNCKFLNVLQGETHSDAEDWYQRMKKYCDPKQYPNDHFNGWSMGGQNMCDIHLVLYRIITLIYDGLLEPGIHDYMHFLGTSKLEWAVLLTDIQNAVRKYHNPNFTITFDCASPFLATANGQIYIQNETPVNGKWTYRMVPSVDNKKYSSDTRLFRDAVLQDNIFNNFEDSPITDGLKISDICCYAPGMLNKIGKEGKTSWDSFSYAIQMGHNIWSHINAVQEANQQYKNGNIPNMLIDNRFDTILFKDLINEIFSAQDKTKSLNLIDKYSSFWLQVIGTRGSVGKKTINATTKFNQLFDAVIDNTEHSDSFNEDEEHNLDLLEEEL